MNPVRLAQAGAMAALALMLVGCQTYGASGPSPANLQFAAVDPQVTGDPLAEAQVHFRRGQYGLAERKFRRAVEDDPQSVDAWLGLAASYDHLRRFDLASRAYDKALQLAGPTPAVLNNLGYSYLLRGNLAEARKNLLAAYELDPANPLIQSNLELLDQGAAMARRRTG